MTSQRLMFIGAVIGFSAMLTACGGGPKGTQCLKWIICQSGNEPTSSCGVGIQSSG